jgi:hypothetical protein
MAHPFFAPVRENEQRARLTAGSASTASWIEYEWRTMKHSLLWQLATYMPKLNPQVKISFPLGKISWIERFFRTILFSCMEDQLDFHGVMISIIGRVVRWIWKGSEDCRNWWLDGRRLWLVNKRSSRLYIHTLHWTAKWTNEAWYLTLLTFLLRWIESIPIRRVSELKWDELVNRVVECTNNPSFWQ